MSESCEYRTNTGTLGRLESGAGRDGDRRYKEANVSRILQGVMSFLVAGVVLCPGPARAGLFNVTDVAGFQAALATAESNGESDIIIVAAGTYTVQSTAPLVYSSTEDQSLYIVGAGADTTVLAGANFDAVNPGSVLAVTNSGAPGSHLSISGLTVQGAYGRGVVLSGAGDVTIEDCVFRLNGYEPDAVGGGAEVNVSGTGTAAVRNSSFQDNVGQAAGGGLSLSGDNGSLVLEGNVFQNNQVVSNGRGGGADVYTFYGVATVVNNVFSLNTLDVANGKGGGLAVVAESAVVAGNLFFGNISEGAAGSGSALSIEIPVSTGSLAFTNNTVSQNGLGTVGDSVVMLQTGSSPAYLYNNILWGNGYTDLRLVNSGAPKIYLYSNDIGTSLIPAGAVMDEEGSISQDPLFVDAPGGDFHLQESSPAIDAGTDTADGIPAVDLDGAERIQGAAVDMGAFESEAPPVDPVPDITVNGSDGPLSVGTADTLSITLSMKAGDLVGTDADWWIVAETPFGLYHYSRAGSRWLPGLDPTHQGPLVDFAPLGLPPVSGLPAGVYTFHFGVDTLRNGHVDMGQTYGDSAEVTVTP